MNRDYERETVSRTLDNGMRIDVIQRPELATAAVRVGVRTGSLHEENSLGYGLSHFLEHMAFQGCAGYPGTAAADTLESLGADLNAYTTLDHTCFHVSLPEEHLDRALEIFSSMLRHPTFPEERFLLEREVILRERTMYRDQPDTQLWEQLRQTVFPTHPAGLPVIGYAENIAVVDRERILAYHRARYTPGRSFWVVVSPHAPERIFEKLETLLGDWPRGSLLEPVLVPEPAQYCRRRRETVFADPLARLALGIALPPLNEIPVATLDVACGLLGMSECSVLPRILRQERELAIQVGTSCITAGFGGLFAATAAATPGKLNKLETALLTVLAEVRKTGFTRTEVEREKIQQLAELRRHDRTGAGMAGTLFAAILAGRAPGAADQYRNELAAVSAERINAELQTLLEPSHFNLVRQAPARKTRAATVRSTGAINRFDRIALRNGSTLYRLPERGDGLADVTILLPGGALFESPGQTGIARLCAELLSCGAGKFDEPGFAAALDGCGAELDAGTGTNTMTIRLNMPKSHLKQAMGLLKAMLLTPRFDPRVVKREIDATIAKLPSLHSNPRIAAEREARRLLYGPHVLGRQFEGTPETLSPLCAGTIHTFYQNLWRTPDVQLLATGGEAAELLAEIAEALPWNPAAALRPPAPEFPATRQFGTVELPREQLAILLALPTPAVTEVGMEAFDLLTEAENGLASQLFKRVREDRGLAYHTGMTHFAGLLPGAAEFHASCAPERGDEVAELLRAEIDRLGTAGLTGPELRTAREAAAFAGRKRLETASGVLFAAGLHAYYGEAPERVFELPDCYAKYDDDTVNALLARVFRNAVTVEARAGAIRAIPGK